MIYVARLTNFDIISTGATNTRIHYEEEQEIQLSHRRSLFLTVLSLFSPAFCSTFQMRDYEAIYRTLTLGNGKKISLNSASKRQRSILISSSFASLQIAPKPNTFLPFGSGAHACPGNELARLEMLVLLHHLTTKCRYCK